MKTSELRAKSPEELKKLLAEKRDDLSEKHRSLKAGELANPSSIRALRKDIAKLLTLMNQQEKK